MPIRPPLAGTTISVPTIGVLLDISGASSRLLLDMQALSDFSRDQGPDAEAAGQVGSFVTLKIGRTWVVASIRSTRLADDGSNLIAEVDLFEGECVAMTRAQRR